METDSSSMLYKKFLATPLLEIKPGKEVRFTGEDGIGSDLEKDQRILAAFTHSTFDHSNRQLIVVDIQGVFACTITILFRWLTPFKVPTWIMVNSFYLILKLKCKIFLGSCILIYFHAYLDVMTILVMGSEEVYS